MASVVQKIKNQLVWYLEIYLVALVNISLSK
jgi:hypothetical protein